MYPTLTVKIANPFGQEADRVLNICEQLFRRQLRLCNDDRPLRSQFVTVSEYRVALAAWGTESDRLLKTLYCIAKRHHVRINWYKSTPDRFYLQKSDKDVGLIQC